MWRWWWGRRLSAAAVAVASAAAVVHLVGAGVEVVVEATVAIRNTSNLAHFDLEI